MTSERCTCPELPSANDAAAQAFATVETFRPWSSARNESTIWTERMLAQVRPCAGDVARFAAGL
jgi:hypothetical protein